MKIKKWNLDFEVIKWNLAAEQMFGFTEKEAIGHHVAGLIVSEDVRPKLDQVWQGLIDQAGGTPFVNDNLTKDGRKIICEWHNTNLINTKGKISGVFSVIQDIGSVFCVWALKALQNSMIFTPCCPSAGPTGGLGLACPAGICNLIYAVTFLAIFYSPGSSAC